MDTDQPDAPRNIGLLGSVLELYDKHGIIQPSGPAASTLSALRCIGTADVS